MNSCAGEGGGDGAEMSVFAHLSELRRRLIISIIAIVVTVVVAFVFSEQLLRILMMPLKGLHLKAFNLMDGFMIKWRISLFAGIIAAFPVWAFEIYGFIRPALRRHDRLAVWPMLFSSFALFLTGMAFAFYLLFSMVPTLLGFFPSEIEYLPSADDFISFSTFFMLACGAVFELPPVLVTLVRLRLLRADTLRKQRRIAYFILFAFAEIITPVSDPIVAPAMVMCPLLVLYEVSLLCAFRIEHNRA
jgi:sec-independent protein translocase protein TatC